MNAISLKTLNISLSKSLVIGILVLALGSCTARPNVFTESRDEREQRLAAEQSRLQVTSDPVGRTRIQIRISDILISFLGEAVDTGDIELIEESIAEYRTTILDARLTMLNSGRDGLNDAAGFRDLEIALRQHVRQLDDIGSVLSFDRRQPLDVLIEEMSRIRNEMLDILFPEVPVAA